MRSRTTLRFRKLLAELPASVRLQARKAYEIFAQDMHHPSLRFKKVHATLPVYSARVTSDYRAVGVIDEEVIVWFWIGNHSDYERLLRDL